MTTQHLTQLAMHIPEARCRSSPPVTVPLTVGADGGSQDGFATAARHRARRWAAWHPPAGREAFDGASRGSARAATTAQHRSVALFDEQLSSLLDRIISSSRCSASACCARASASAVASSSRCRSSRWVCTSCAAQLAFRNSCSRIAQTSQHALELTTRSCSSRACTRRLPRCSSSLAWAASRRRERSARCGHRRPGGCAPPAAHPWPERPSPASAASRPAAPHCASSTVATPSSPREVTSSFSSASSSTRALSRGEITDRYTLRSRTSQPDHP